MSVMCVISTHVGMLCLCVYTVASFPGSSPAFCRILYSMRQKAGEEPGNEAMYLWDIHMTLCAV